jgi:ATP/maltotriose-dependent transcriptional regulator MalT
MAKGVIRRNQNRLDEAEELIRYALELAGEQGDVETESWSRGNLANLLAVRGNLDEALAHAQRNYEVTERLGDVFTRTWALVNLSLVRTEKGDGPGAVGAIERAIRIHGEGMDNGGEAEAWRGMVLARALLCAGRIDEACDAAEQSARMAREREMFFTLPLALRALAEARIAAGDSRATDTLDEGAKVARQFGDAYEAERIEQLRSSVGVGS